MQCGEKCLLVEKPVRHRNPVDENDRDVVAPPPPQLRVRVHVDEHRGLGCPGVPSEDLPDPVQGVVAEMASRPYENNDAPLDRQVEGP